MVSAVEMQWTDGLFDIAFAEDHPDVVLTASGDGGIQLWNIKNPQVFRSARCYDNLGVYISVTMINFT